MKIFLLTLSLAITGYLQAQIGSYHIFRRDTIELPDIVIKNAVALHFNNAIVMADKKTFIKHLSASRKELNADIKVRQRATKRTTDQSDLIPLLLKSAQDQLAIVDTILSTVKQSGSDTVQIDYQWRAGIPAVTGFLALAIEKKRCVILNLASRRQHFVVRQRGRMEQGKMGAVGSSFYFIPDASTHFFSKSDFASLQPRALLQ